MVAASLLLAKGRKSAAAILYLIEAGLIEDAIILARSLAGLCIDLAYLAASPEHMRERAREWQAAGRVARRRFAEMVRTAAPDASLDDWPETSRRAKEWKKPGAILRRAKLGGVEPLYEWAYRHGSSFEHSDAWSVLMFEDGAEKYRDDIAHLALLTTAYALVAITQAWSRLCGIELGPVDSQMEEAFLRAFPRSSSGRPA